MGRWLEGVADGGRGNGHRLNDLAANCHPFAGEVVFAVKRRKSLEHPRHKLFVDKA